MRTLGVVLLSLSILAPRTGTAWDPSERVLSLRAEITTKDAKKEEDANIRLTVSGSRLAHGPGISWVVNHGWTGDSGIPAGEWFGSGAKWYHNTTGVWRNSLNGLGLTMADLGAASVEVEFQNNHSSDDSWSFTMRLVAVTPHGDVDLLSPLPNPVTLRNNLLSYFWVATAVIPRGPDPYDAALKAKDCARAEHFAANAGDNFYVALCYGRKGDHENAARLAHEIQPLLGGIYQQGARNLEDEQRSLLTIQQNQWQRVIVPITYSDAMKQQFASALAAFDDQWKTQILKLANQRCFGPISLEIKERGWTPLPNGGIETGSQPILQNSTYLDARFHWVAYNFVKRFRKDNEFSNANITANTTVSFSAHDKTLVVELTVPTSSSLHAVPDSWNPEFNIINIINGLLNFSQAADPAVVTVMTIPLNQLVQNALPWLPAQLRWTIYSLKVGPESMEVGLGFGK
jgi:hypothetical protein